MSLGMNDPTIRSGALGSCMGGLPMSMSVVVTEPMYTYPLARLPLCSVRLTEDPVQRMLGDRRTWQDLQRLSVSGQVDTAQCAVGDYCLPCNGLSQASKRRLCQVFRTTRRKAVS